LTLHLERAVFLTHGNGPNIVKEEDAFILDHWVSWRLFQRKPQFLLLEVHFRMQSITKLNIATPPHATWHAAIWHY